jgi:hypothetical protein
MSTTLDEAKRRASNYINLKSALEPKQETLEEYSNGLYKQSLKDDVDLTFSDGVKLGAKWQQEKMYSKEEVIAIVEKSRETGLTAEYLLLTEQFKKK